LWALTVYFVLMGGPASPRPAPTRDRSDTGPASSAGFADVLRTPPMPPSRAQVADEVVGPQRHESLHHIGVELRPGVAADLLARLVGGHGPAVGTVGDHRVEGIGDGEDAGAQWDDRAHQASGIPLTVPALVVAGDDPPRLVEVGHPRDQLLAHRDVAAHQLHLLW